MDDIFSDRKLRNIQQWFSNTGKVGLVHEPFLLQFYFMLFRIIWERIYCVRVICNIQVGCVHQDMYKFFGLAYFWNTHQMPVLMGSVRCMARGHTE